MVDKYFADTHLLGAGPQVGQSQPVRIKAENGKVYFLKTNIVNRENQDAVFFQELLSSLLAVRLNVPVPQFAIIEIEKDFIENNGYLRFNGRFEEGLYFATEEIVGVEDNLLSNYHLAQQKGQPRIKKAWNAYFKDVSNSSQLVNIIAFDLLVYNFDRFSNEGNLLVAKSKAGEKKIYAIDHGHCFYTPYYNSIQMDKHKILKLNHFDLGDKNSLNQYLQWYLNLLLRTNKMGVGLGTIFTGLEQNINFSEGNPFLNVIADIETLQEEEIVEMIEQIPVEWISDGDSQKNLYLNFLLKQKYLVRELVDIMAVNNMFSNHVGGVLDWNRSEELHGTLSLDM